MVKRFFIIISIFIVTIEARDARVPEGLKIHGTKQTLHKILDTIERKEKGIYLRFGDGDVIINYGKPTMDHTYLTPAFIQEMRETFALTGKNVFKTLPLYSKGLGGWEPGMFHLNHEETDEQAMKWLTMAIPFWGEPMTDVYSHVALAFAATQYPDFCIRFLQELKAAAPIVFVGNGSIPQETISTLFGNCAFIKTPALNSHAQLDRIEQETLQALDAIEGYKIVVVAMGNSGRVLNKRLWHKRDNVFLFDFGSLIEPLSGDQTRAWIKLTHFDGKAFLNKLKSRRFVKVIYGAALLDIEADRRKEEYLRGLKNMHDYGFRPYIVEAITAGPSFFEEYSGRVFYSQVNDASLRNKGINEARSMLKFLDQSGFADDDIIVKFTGRYYFENDEYFRAIENNPGYRGYVRIEPNENIFTGAFALECGLMKDFYRTIDPISLERNMICIETAVAEYVQAKERQGMPFYKVPKLNIVARWFFQGGNNTLTYM